MLSKSIKVLVLAAPGDQDFLRRALEDDISIQVSGCAASIEEARSFLRKTTLDAFVVDLDALGADAVVFLQQLTSTYTQPLIAVSSMSVWQKQAKLYGAAAFLTKVLPTVNERTQQSFIRLLQLQVKTLAHTDAVPRFFAGAGETKEAALSKQVAGNGKAAGASEQPPEPDRPVSTRLIAMGASLGGTEATLTLLQELPTDLPGIVMVQHMPPGFTQSYARRLDRSCSLSVREAETGALVRDGEVWLAKGGEQLRVIHTTQGFVLHSVPGPKVSGFCPSVDVLFASVAHAAGAAAVGIILTGIGRDGAQGLKLMHDSGAMTWGQSEDSCVVYGMPAAAYKAGAVDEELNLPAIGRALKKYFRRY